MYAKEPFAEISSGFPLHMAICLTGGEDPLTLQVSGLGGNMGFDSMLSWKQHIALGRDVGICTLPEALRAME